VIFGSLGSFFGDPAVVLADNSVRMVVPKLLKISVDDFLKKKEFFFLIMQV
jgi:hypothetical protein